LVIGAVLLKEQSSLPALVSVAKLAPEARRKRRETFSKLRVPCRELKDLFRKKPYSAPALESSDSNSKCQKIAAIIVNYNSGARLGACLLSLTAAISELKADLKVTSVLLVRLILPRPPLRRMPIW
jgi:hypothetical protein